MAFSQETTALIGSVCLTTMHIFAISLTFFRLYHRHSISRLWWDDYLAAVAVIVDCGTIIDLWLGLSESTSSQSLQEQMLRYKLGFLSIVAVEWTTRIALALAFARIFQPREKTRSYAISMAILFFLLFIVIIIQSVWFCNNISAWISTSLVKCNFHGELLYFLVVANLLADALLVCSPLYALRHLRLPSEERRLIFTCFAGSALMSLACIATTIFQFVPVARYERKSIRIILGYLEGSVSLIVCNLMVIVTYIYKVFRQERAAGTSSSSTSNRPQGTDRTSRPIPSYAEEYSFTEISEAYFTVPVSTLARSNGATV